MREYTLKVELLTETLFGSGESIPGDVDEEVLHDVYGFPYMKGKTIKGKLREEALHVQMCIGAGQAEEEIVDRLFGTGDAKEDTILKFSDLTVSSGVRQLLMMQMKDIATGIDPQDILEAMTDIRNFTRIEETGVAKKGSLRRIRVIHRGYHFYCTITAQRELSMEEEILLAAAAASLRHLGSMETRGKGHVKCTLWKEKDNITEERVRLLKGERS